MSNTLKLYPRQLDLIKLIEVHKYTLAYGSSRGGKSYALMCVIVARALGFPGSNHCVIRSTANSIVSTIWPTAMSVLNAIAPGYREEVDVNNSNRCITLHNGSTIWFMGAQDDDAVEKVMGAEFATIFLNEVVRLDLKTFQKIRTRLNADNRDANGVRIDLKLFADCNPKAKSHWVYQQWCKKVRPGTQIAISNPAAYAALQFDKSSNPGIDPTYYADMSDDSAEEQSSFLLGEWYDELEGAYFSKADIDANRDDPPDSFGLIAIAIDPAVTNTPTSDETGIFVVGMKLDGDQGHYYPLADLSGRYHPHEWAEKAAKAYHQYAAAMIVVEVNQGGDQNVHTLRTADPRLNIVSVRAGAGQGKNMRAQPIATLMKAGRIHHPFDETRFAELEDQMLKMTGDYDRKRGKSPDRLDAYVYAISELLTGDHFAKPVVQSKIAGFMR